MKNLFSSSSEIRKKYILYIEPRLDEKFLKKFHSIIEDFYESNGKCYNKGYQLHCSLTGFFEVQLNSSNVYKLEKKFAKNINNFVNKLYYELEEKSISSQVTDYTIKNSKEIINKFIVSHNLVHENNQSESKNLFLTRKLSERAIARLNNKNNFVILAEEYNFNTLNLLQIYNNTRLKLLKLDHNYSIYLPVQLNFISTNKLLGLCDELVGSIFNYNGIFSGSVKKRGIRTKRIDHVSIITINEENNINDIGSILHTAFELDKLFFNLSQLAWDLVLYKTKTNKNNEIIFRNVSRVKNLAFSMLK